jgi:hypothetical protein
VSSASTSFTPTACDAETFAPKVTATMGRMGATARNTRSPFAATISQAVGESAQLNAAVTLPASLSAGLNALPVFCTEAQLAVAACPDGSRVGTATIASPLLPDPVQGPVFSVAKQGQLPGVGVEFGGVLPFVLSGNTAIAGGRLQNIFNGLPDVPQTSFTLAVDGRSGLLVANRDICTGPPPTVDAALVGQSGASVTRSSPVTLVGCTGRSAPHAKVSARGLAGAHPVLQLTVTKGAAKLRSLSLKLPKSIQVGKVKGGLRAVGSFRVSKRSLKLSRKGTLTVKLPSKGANRVTVKLSGGRIHASKALKKQLKRHKSVRLKLRLLTTDVQGRRNSLSVGFAGRR